MNLPDYITRLAQEAALGAINVSSSVIQQQITTQQSQNGVMIIQFITTNSDGSTSLLVQDSQGGNQQTVSYLGSDYIYLGQNIFVANGFAQ